MFNRYWRFQSVPGLFVENDEQYVDNEYFEQLVPQKDEKKTDVENKENVENAMEVDEVESNVVNGGETMTVTSQIKEKREHKWYFYEEKEDVDRLIEGLNCRGIRESVLRTALIENKNDIVSAIEECPKDEIKMATDKLSKRKRAKSLHGQVENDSAEQLMELSLREQLLDMEERIFSGSLGQLKNVSCF